jgi:hypothetical protein
MSSPSNCSKDLEQVDESQDVSLEGSKKGCKTILRSYAKYDDHSTRDESQDTSCESKQGLMATLTSYADIEPPNESQDVSFESERDIMSSPSNCAKDLEQVDESQDVSLEGSKKGCKTILRSYAEYDDHSTRDESQDTSCESKQGLMATLTSYADIEPPNESQDVSFESKRDIMSSPSNCAKDLEQVDKSQDVSLEGSKKGCKTILRSYAEYDDHSTRDESQDKIHTNKRGFVSSTSNCAVDYGHSKNISQHSSCESEQGLMSPLNHGTVVDELQKRQAYSQVASMDSNDSFMSSIKSGGFDNDQRLKTLDDVIQNKDEVVASLRSSFGDGQQNEDVDAEFESKERDRKTLTINTGKKDQQLSRTDDIGTHSALNKMNITSANSTIRGGIGVLSSSRRDAYDKSQKGDDSSCISIGSKADLYSLIRSISDEDEGALLATKLFQSKVDLLSFLWNMASVPAEKKLINTENRPSHCIEDVLSLLRDMASERKLHKKNKVLNEVDDIDVLKLKSILKSIIGTNDQIKESSGGAGMNIESKSMLHDKRIGVVNELDDRQKIRVIASDDDPSQTLDALLSNNDENDERKKEKVHNKSAHISKSVNQVILSDITNCTLESSTPSCIDQLLSSPQSNQSKENETPRAKNSYNKYQGQSSMQIIVEEKVSSIVGHHLEDRMFQKDTNEQVLQPTVNGRGDSGAAKRRLVNREINNQRGYGYSDNNMHIGGILSVTNNKLKNRNKENYEPKEDYDIKEVIASDDISEVSSLGNSSIASGPSNYKQMIRQYIKTSKTRSKNHSRDISRSLDQVQKDLKRISLLAEKEKISHHNEDNSNTGTFPQSCYNTKMGQSNGNSTTQTEDISETCFKLEPSKHDIKRTQSTRMKRYQRKANLNLSIDDDVFEQFQKLQRDIKEKERKEFKSEQQYDLAENDRLYEEFETIKQLESERKMNTLWSNCDNDNIPNVEQGEECSHTAQEWMVKLPDNKHEGRKDDEAFTSLLDQSNAPINTKYFEEKKKRYIGHTDYTNPETKNKKKNRRKKVLKKLKNVLRMKRKSKATQSDDASVLGIVSIERSENKKDTKRKKFSKFLRKRTNVVSGIDTSQNGNGGGCSDSDNESNVTEHLEQMIQNLHMEDIHDLDFSFTDDSEVSEYVCSNENYGYATLS